ncbi:hypothetical protein V1514DRAFT_169958 [Lipomyces japonicus]|uniref:uncharacterized protein n=1 Tax=Lipomyces japonicus TaxID=56871 RepID=UPI0034CF239C
MAHDVAFNLTPKPINTLVPRATAISLARSIVTDLSKHWKRGKTYTIKQIVITTFARTLYGEKWFSRVSVHEEPYEWFKQGICDDHTENELDYIPLFRGFTEIDAGDSGWRGINARYAFPGPLSVREMPEWVLAVEPDPTIREFFVISVPADYPISKNSVKGRYTSIEYVRELPDGKVEWTMAQTSDAGGWIPKWILNMNIEGTISEDVPHFIDWAKHRFARQ